MGARRRRFLEAVLRGDVRTVEHLITQGEAIDQYTEAELPLHTACRLGHTDLVRVLLQHGTDLHQPTEYRHELPVYLASQAGHVAVVRLLVQAGGLEGGGAQAAMTAAARYGQVDVLEVLLQCGLDPNMVLFNETSPLTIAAGKGFKRCLETLVRYGAKVKKEDNRGCPPLISALVSHQTDMVRLLLQAGADPNVGCTQFQAYALHIAVYEEQLECVELLCQSGADINITCMEAGSSPIYVAAQMGYVDILEYLVSLGADPDIGTFDTGNTALFAAMETRVSSLYLSPNKSVGATVMALIQAGADVDHQNQFCQGPLQYAVQHCFCDVALLLLAADCDVRPMAAWPSRDKDLYDVSVECPTLRETYTTEVYSPRCLMRLCRRTIRLLFRSKGCWPFRTKVKALPLPKVLKHFLLYKDVQTLYNSLII